MNLLLFLKFIKFCAVGVSGLIIDFGVTVLLKEIVRVNKYIANSIGFVCAASSNFFLNRIWTFRSSDPHVMRQYLLFFAISLTGLVINNLIVWILNDKLDVDFCHILRNHFDVQCPEKLNFYASKSIAILAVTVWNFSGNYFLTF